MYSQKKIQQQLNELKQEVYVNFQSLTDLKFWRDTREERLTVPTDVDWQSVEIGSSWEGRDDYYWLRFDIQVPELTAQQKFVTHLDLGRTGGGGNSGFEGLIYLDGAPQQAVDANHQDMYLDQQYSGQKLTVAILMWTGLEGGGVHQIQHYILQTASAGILNETIRDTYRYLKVIDETILELDEDEPLKYEYQKLLDHALHQFYWGDMDLQTITKVAGEVMDSIQQFIADHPNQKKAFKISAIGHTHIDVAWLWRLRHTREKTARSFSTVLELMKEYPDYKFFHSTPQVYQFIKEDHPELYSQIKKRVAEGRWEADGGTWLEPDANIPSGEALTRQFLYGSRFFAHEFGVKQTVLWLPDVFGYSWALPQIMKGFGIENFMTTKISWNDTNRMPHDTFMWEGIDGSQVLTHFVTTVDPGTDYHDSSKWYYTYNGQITPHTVMGTYHVYADKPLNNDLLLSYGFGDGGGGPQREMIENIDIINQLPGLPTVENTRIDDYFVQLRKNISASQLPIPNWNGELYLEYHRGTYTSQARVKQQNRQLELQLRDVEIRYTKAVTNQLTAYPKAELDDVWEMVLRNQFHDILPGSSIHEVYEDNKAEYAHGFEVIQKLNQQLNDLELESKTNNYVVDNPNAWFITELVEIEQSASGYFVDEDGHKLAAEKSGDHYQVLVVAKPLQATTIHFVVAEKTNEVVALQEQRQSIANDFYRLTWNDAGQLTEIYDLENQREVLSESGLGNVLTVYEDRPTEYDNWNIDVDYPEKPTILAADQIDVIQDSELEKKVVFHYSFLNSTIKQTVTLYQHSRRIDFENEIDWQDHNHLLRTAFETALLADQATFDVQYGNVKRPTNSNTSWEAAKFETVAHKWADLSQRDYGVALLNDGKYGYSVKQNIISMSLLKAGVYPDTEADIGEHRFTYSLLPHEGDFVSGEVERVAMELNNPLTVVTGKTTTISQALFDFEAKNPVAVDAIKISEDQDAVILRLHEYTGQNEKVTIKPNFDYTDAKIVRLDESEVGGLDKQDEYVVELKPYQVVSVAFWMKK